MFNHILGQQDPATGMIAYFLPMLPGAHKVYSTPDSSFWCCVGSGFENQAKYGEASYYHAQNELYVHLFITSELNWKEKGIKLVQQTNFPESGVMQFKIESAAVNEFVFNIRYPSWATTGATVKVNGKKIAVKNMPGSYIRINRKWKNGDIVEVNFPMTLRLVPTNDIPNKVAIAYGPIVLAGQMGTAGFIGSQPYSNPQLHNDYYTYNYNVPAGINTFIQLDKNKLNDFIKPVAGEKLTFKILNEAVIMKPLFDIHRERSVLYWDIK